MHAGKFPQRLLLSGLLACLPLLAQAGEAEIQGVYERSCKACHGTPATGAPQTGDAQAWAPRVAQGADILLDHTIDGYKAMPPMGMCMDCTEDQFLALIEYMSGTSLD